MLKRGCEGINNSRSRIQDGAIEIKENRGPGARNDRIHNLASIGVKTMNTGKLIRLFSLKG